MKILVLPMILGLILCAIGARAADEGATRGVTVQVNGIDLYYETRGSGNPLLLLHGFGACGREWAPFVPKLSENHRLIIVDMRGHGRSTNPANTFTHRQSAADLLALLDAIEIERFAAMGISSGGMTLLHMATRAPDRIEAMVLIGAATYFPDQAREIMRTASMETLPPEVREMQFACAARGEAQVRELVSQFSGFQDSFDDVNFTAPLLSTIRARTLVVYGDRDPFFPVEIAISMYRAIPDAGLWIVPHGGHVPVYDPAIAFAERAAAFLRQ